MDNIKILLQYLLPKRWLTQLVGWCASRNGGWLTKISITLFVRFYKVNMQEVKQPEIGSYLTFNEFFVRRLREDARSIDTDPSILVMPTDGIISQMGYIKGKHIFHAKGHYYSLEALLAGNDTMTNYFQDGCFVTIYLSPGEYHRVHMPCNSVLRDMVYVPGELFSVHPRIVANIPNLFARNERLICLFETDFGPMAQILVGSIIAGSIETIWSGTVTPPREGIIKRWHYPTSDASNSVVLLKGQEMGCFKLGSTVINLFTGDKVLLDDQLHINYITRIGQRMARGITHTNNSQ